MNKTVTLTPCPNCGGSIPVEAPQGLCPKCVLRGAAKPMEAAVSATATAEIPSLERLAEAFPQLEVLELIGRGGMGFVFKARQPHLDRFVALKLLPDKLAANPQFTERFNREGRVLARLNHPNIVSVFDFGQTGGFYYLLMEFVDGVNLRQAMQAGRFSPAEALALVPKVCEALQYAHEQGILHRDIKPENILLDAKGQVKIADFGIAKLLGQDAANVTLTNTGTALGTPHYMAPEQLEKPATVDHRADLYSLGVVFYEMLTGELPIGRFAAPSAKTPMHAAVDDVVFRTLAKDRELRFQTANEFKAGVEQLGSGGVEGGQGSDTADPAAPAPAWVTRLGWVWPSSWWIIAGVVGVSLSLLVPLAMIVLMLTGQSDVGPSGFWRALKSAGLPAVAGTLMGWLGLNQIREKQESERTLGLALYACLTWPLLVLLGANIALPLALIRSGSAPQQLWVGRLLLLLLPFGALGAAFWTIRGLRRWAQGKAGPTGAGLLKWVVVVVLVTVMVLLLWIDRGSMSVPAPVVATPAPPTPIDLPWPPSIPPGGKPNLDGIRQEAADLTARGRYDEALQRVLWYHQHALEFEPAQVGVRLSFALSQWEELARHYPPAKAALIETRDRGILEFQNGGGYFGLFQEVAALNNVLKDPEATYSLFKRIHARDAGLARQCYLVVEEQLIERKEYVLCLKLIPDPQRRFEQARQNWERGKALADRTPEINRSGLRKQMESEFVANCRRLIEILVGTGHKEQAIQIQEQALEVLDIEELRLAVTDAEQKVRIP